MSEMNSIEVSNVSKIYKLFDRPFDKVLEAFSITKKKHYQEFYALDNISFSVKKGETFGIVGTNGSGKSTLLKILTGVVTPNTGNIKVEGKISALLELGAGFNPAYTGMENIYLNGTTMGYSRAEMDKRVDAILEFADIGDFIYQPVRSYSSGMFARLAFAVAINVEPEVLIVDEALSVGDVFFQNKCFKKFEELKSKGITILFVSHDMASVKQMCSRALWIERGVQQMCGECVEVCNAYSNSISRNSFTVNKQNSNGEYDDKSDGVDWSLCPHIDYARESKLNDDVTIQSAYFLNVKGDITTELYAGEVYRFIQIFDTKIKIEKCITGFVLETLKGLWMINSNTSISDKQKTFIVDENSRVRSEFEFVMPSLMQGEYLVGTAVSVGEIEDFEVLTWLYQVLKVNIINRGANSAMIDIAPNIAIQQKKC